MIATPLRTSLNSPISYYWLTKPVPLTAARELLAGMISDQTSVEIDDERELLRYCHAASRDCWGNDE